MNSKIEIIQQPGTSLLEALTDADNLPQELKEAYDNPVEEVYEDPVEIIEEPVELPICHICGEYIQEGYEQGAIDKDKFGITLSQLREEVSLLRK